MAIKWKNIFLMFLIIMPFISEGQYLGGNANGYGFSLNSTIDLSLQDGLYNGGNGCGYFYSNALAANLASINGFNKGGFGNGFTNMIVNNGDLSLIDNLYNGGIGRGEIQLAADHIKLSICGDTLIWNGNQNIIWSNPGNWDCGTLPNNNSVVYLPSDRMRYPYIYSTQIIKKLSLQLGSSLNLVNSAKLYLTGQ